VYSLRGISRSSTIILSYYMLFLGLSFKDAHTILRTLRTSAQPNEGFLNQITTFEKETNNLKKQLTVSGGGGSDGLLDSGELERKDREFLASQNDDESWLEEWSNTRRRTMSTLTPEVAKKDEVLLQNIVGTPNPRNASEGRSRTVSMLPSLTHSPIRPLVYPPPRSQDFKTHPQKSATPLTTITTSMEEWNLPSRQSSSAPNRMRSATSWEYIDKQGKRDLWLPDDFILPPPPRPPLLPSSSTSSSTTASLASSRPPPIPNHLSTKLKSATSEPIIMLQ